MQKKIRFKFLNNQTYAKRLKYIVLITFKILLTISVYAQDILNKKLTVNLIQATPIEALEVIKKNSGINILYGENISAFRKKTVTLESGITIQKAIELALKNTDFNYEWMNGNILIRKKQKKSSTENTAYPKQVNQSTSVIKGTITNPNGIPLSGVSIKDESFNVQAYTDDQGNFELKSVGGKSKLITVSAQGYETEKITWNGEALNISLQDKIANINEVVVVGYGSQRKSDITGSVGSLSNKRLENAPNINLSQAIQGGIAGVNIQTSTAGAEPTDNIMIRGRNSIKASNAPLIVIDGVAGNLKDVNPSDVKSVEVLKDASSAAIYGSRGSNGVVLITTKSGKSGETKFKYDGFYSVQSFANLPEIMDGEEFYQFKMERDSSSMTSSEKNVYELNSWVNWPELAFRKGMSTGQNLSLSGGFYSTNYYLSGNFQKVRGLAINDDYKRVQLRTNIDTKLKNWLTIGTKTQLNFIDATGVAATFGEGQGVYWFNPLTTPYDENGKQNIYPWPDDPHYTNPLQGLLAKNIDETYQVISNNFLNIDFPFLEGLNFKLNSGIRFGFTNDATYYGRDTNRGVTTAGDATLKRQINKNIVLENILNYNKTFNKHHIFLTGVYSFENVKSNSNGLNAEGFPNDILGWYGSQQASLIVPNFSNSETTLLSSMIRINYAFDNRYLLTITGRNDGYSGFGFKTKRGFFPSMAFGWNINQESFFPWKNIFSQLKLRGSYGMNGNQAVSAYETISRMIAENYVYDSSTLPGYIPSKLGTENLGWESTKTLNLGLDFGIFQDRIYGDINLYHSNTYNLLLDRTVSPVHAVNSITQNIGETENKGIELTINANLLKSANFSWETSGNFSIIKNRIRSLYGLIGENGKETDDVANNWFIGQPINVNYGFKWIGVWQLDEREEAKLHNTQPGFIKIQDISGPEGVPDGILSPAYDRIIIGQRDPKMTWGLNNIFNFKDFSLSVFMYGMHGMTKENSLLSDAVGRTIRLNTTKKNWWREDNPTNDWYANKLDANVQEGYTAAPYENASFVRIKDISITYKLPQHTLKSLGLNSLKMYLTGRNLFTITKFGGMDPELNNQWDVPLQKEYAFGLNLEF